MSFNTDEEASCCQAKIRKIDILNENTENLYCENNEYPPILSLDDYMLHKISEMLSISDKINFAFTCSRFFSVMKSFSSSKLNYQTTKTFNDWSPQKVKNFFAIFASQIKTLDIDNSPLQESLYDLIPCCHNIVQLDLYCDFLDTDEMIKLIFNMEKLEIVNIHGSSKIDDELLQYFKNFKGLKKLSITENMTLTGKGIENLRGLEALTLFWCPSITTECFRNICTNLKNLRFLDVSNGDFAERGDCKIIAENLSQLESLKINCENDDIDCLKKFGNLKKLEIELGSNSSSEHIFINFLQLNTNQLEKLYLTSNTASKKIISAIKECKKLKALHIKCWDITDEIVSLISELPEIKDLSLHDCKIITDNCVLEIFEKCLKLQYLNLECCDSLTTDLFEKAITVLQRQHAEHLRSTHIYINGTCGLSNNEFFKKLPKFDTYTDLFRISILLEDEDDDNGPENDE